MDAIGRKNCVIGGFLFIILATVGFGSLAYVKDNQTFAALSFVYRGFQGIADASLSIAGYSIVTLLYPAKKMIYLGFCATARGLGSMLGPALAQIIYTGTNYNFGLTFYIIAGIITLFMFLALFLLPNTLNKRAVRYENN